MLEPPRQLALSSANYDLNKDVCLKQTPVISFQTRSMRRGVKGRHEWRKRLGCVPRGTRRAVKYRYLNAGEAGGFALSGTSAVPFVAGILSSDSTPLVEAAAWVVSCLV